MEIREETKYLNAKKKVEELKNLYGFAIRGLVAICIVGAVNYYLNEWERPWFLWVVFGVGLSLILRTFKIYGPRLFLGKDWEERKIQEFMDKNDL